MTSYHEDLAALLAAPYKVGGVLTLRRVADCCSTADTAQPELFRVKIAKLQQPWTLSCGMVVDILDDSSTDEAEHKTTTASVAQTAFLKLYDWRFAPQLRDDQEIDPWNEKSAAAYARFTLADGGEQSKNFLRRLEVDEKGFRDETEDDWDAGQNEVFLAYQMRAMYRAETSVYKRLGTAQGEEPLTPRFITAVELDVASPGLDGGLRDMFRVKGILLEYISGGFSLSKLGAMAPPERWQAVVDRAVGIARALGDYGVLNRDVRPDNFLVTRPRGDHGVDKADEVSGEFGVLMVDFGQSRVRREDESDFEWGRDKWQQDEEGAVGQVMRHRLRKLGREISYTPSERYIEFAEGEDDE